MPASNFLGVVSEMFCKIASFFDIFDLSFFVSGVLCLGAIAFWYELSDKAFSFDFDGWLRIFQLVIICYVLGLISFSSGRWLRTGFIGREIRCAYRKISGVPNNSQSSSRGYFRTLLISHNLTGQDFIKDYPKCHEDDRVADCLYQRMWAEIRQSRDLAPSLVLLNRWWVMAATYDGIAMSLIFYILIFTAWLSGIGVSEKWGSFIEGSFAYVVVLVLILFALSLASFREAGRLESNQREELVATMAYLCHIRKDHQGNSDQGWRDNDIT